MFLSKVVDFSRVGRGGRGKCPRGHSKNLILTLMLFIPLLNVFFNFYLFTIFKNLYRYHF